MKYYFWLGDEAEDFEPGKAPASVMGFGPAPVDAWQTACFYLPALNDGRLS